jgi:2'-hydroxyisoflavone reductase
MMPIATGACLTFYVALMRLLVLGGTAFVGRHFVTAAIDGGHEVVLFTRGRTNPELFPGAGHLRGDRDGSLDALGGREFDAAIDLCGYVPRVVRASAGLLAGSVDRYPFVSSISVYADAPYLTEASPVQQLPEPGSEDVAAHYGALKALCEEEAEAAFPGRALVIRPGLVVGPHDYTGRFSYWPRRIAAGGEVLAPGSPEARVWMIDGRDLGEWMLEMVEAKAVGVFNAVGPAEPLRFGELLEECRAVSGSDAELTWVDEAFLADRGVEPWTELPLWIPAGDGGHPDVDISRALSAGLAFRPVADTIRGVLADDEPPAREAGLDAAREAALLADWHASRGG